MAEEHEFEIAGRKVGTQYPPLVIAEIGINHNGSLETAFQMVDAAFQADAEIIKHQTHIVEDEMSNDAKTIVPSNADTSIFEIMRECALSEDDERALMSYVQDKGMIFISTPFSRAAALRLRNMDVPAYKIGSGECNNYPLVSLIASFGKPVMLSTGMNTIESIRKSVDILENAQVEYCLLHCTNVYPTPYEEVRLGGMTELQRAFPGALVGLSDHTVDNYACLGAVALGASVLERHFTDSKDRIGPDIACSMDGPELSDLIQGSRALQLARGGTKEPSKLEAGTIAFAFASVVTIKPIRKGEKFTEENIWVKRPGTGEFLAEDYKSLLGKVSKINLESDVQLKRADV